MNNALSQSHIVIVTGASSGFGALTVRVLAQDGHTVNAGMRDLSGRNEDVPNSVELRWRSGEHQAAFTL